MKNGPFFDISTYRRKRAWWSFQVEDLVQIISPDLILDFLLWGIGRKAGLIWDLPNTIAHERGRELSHFKVEHSVVLVLGLSRVLTQVLGWPAVSRGHTGTQEQRAGWQREGMV